MLPTRRGTVAPCVHLLNSIVSNLPRWGELKAEKTVGLVLGHFTRNAKGLARQGFVLLGKRLGLLKQLQDGFVRGHGEVARSHTGQYQA